KPATDADAMDPQLYHNVLLAIQVSHSHGAAPQERSAAYAFSEEFQESRGLRDNPRASQVDATGAVIATDATLAPMDVFTRQHFALHVLEHYVLTHWNPPAADEPVFIKEKKVALLAQIAKRQFPSAGQTC
ncbi:hypothetical protein PINS_up024205, partial [Pythium insidiosum]